MKTYLKNPGQLPADIFGRRGRLTIYGKLIHGWRIAKYALFDSGSGRLSEPTPPGWNRSSHEVHFLRPVGENLRTQSKLHTRSISCVTEMIQIVSISARTSSLSRAQRPDTRRAIRLCRVQWQKSWLTAPTSACRRRGWSSACNNARERGELLRPPQAAASLARRTCPFQ